ncbi:MAG TPA: DUF1761 domain-containing protein [Sphingomicrobium sp.]|nr:DUF1761 domain-containing protein [Sphingomicrobium sp.]
MHLALLWATLAGAVLGSLADWLFAGVLFHERYKIHPEIWRPTTNDVQRVILAQLTTLITAGAFTLLAYKLDQVQLKHALALAAMVWLIGPVPLLIGNGLFIKIDWVITADHAAGWLVKLLLCGAAVAFFL